MPRNLIICFDGTHNEFGSKNTNVVRLVQTLERNSSLQHVYYDPGVGTLPEPGVWTWLGKKISELWGLAFGSGLTWKVGEAYSFLMDYWEPGDQIFVFGFSRGAYSARILSGLLHSIGLLPHGNYNLIPYVLRLYEAGGKKNDKYFRLNNEFRKTFARRIDEADKCRRVPVHFLGLWDTVSSVGWAWERGRFPFTTENSSVNIIRHAVSLDERRWFFRQNLMTKTGDQDLQERWFPGVHSDVGGGYQGEEKEGGLWRLSFRWLMDEAKKAGLRIDQNKLDHLLAAGTSQPWAEPKHESLWGPWWVAEFFPKMTWRSKLGISLPAVGLGRHRKVPKDALIDQSTLLRIRDDNLNYSPHNLSERFLDEVRKLSEIPDAKPYEK